MTPDDLPGFGFRVFLPAFFIVYILVGGPLSAWFFERKYGFDPLALSEPDPVMQFGEAYRNGLFVVILALCFTYLVWPDIHAYLGPIGLLAHPAVRTIGVTAMLASLVVLRVAQLQLKSSWRFGVDRARPPDELITTGLFALSRNPIYLALLLTGIGFFLALPNAITFAVPNLAFVLLQTRIRTEEAFLREVWGEAFDRYCEATPRWLLGRDRPDRITTP